MKSGDMSKTTAIAVAVLSLAMYAIAQTGGGVPSSAMPDQSGATQEQNQNLWSQQNP